MAAAVPAMGEESAAASHMLKDSAPGSGTDVAILRMGEGGYERAMVSESRQHTRRRVECRPRLAAPRPTRPTSQGDYPPRADPPHGRLG